MLPNIDFTTTQAYKYLADHYIDIVAENLKDLFKTDNQRFTKFSTRFEDILLDYSKTASPMKLSPCWCNWPGNVC